MRPFKQNLVIYWWVSFQFFKSYIEILYITNSLTVCLYESYRIRNAFL